MIELLVLIAGVIGLIRFNRAMNNAASALESKSSAWTYSIKSEALKDISEIKVEEHTVQQANDVIDRIDKLKI